ncbi:hypothetical protein FKM82_028852 [Ascaphus truei]
MENRSSGNPSNNNYRDPKSEGCADTNPEQAPGRDDGSERNSIELAAALSQKRSIEGQLQDLRKDLEFEHAGRKKAEKQQRYLGEELEALKSEWDTTLDSITAQPEV